MCSGQVEDTLELYDIFNLRGQTNRVPEFIKCKQAPAVEFDALHHCLAWELSDGDKSASYPIKRVSVFSEIESNFRMASSGFHERYRSTFRLEIDSSGQVSDVKTISHCVESISENRIKDKLLVTLWEPALKDLVPVASKLVLEIIYEDQICHEEYWAKNKFGLLQWFPTYRKELMSIYLEKGVMWDLDILSPMMTYKDSIALSKSFDIVALKAHGYIDSLETIFVEEKESYKQEDCRTSPAMAPGWIDGFYNYMEKELKEELKRGRQ